MSRWLRLAQKEAGSAGEDRRDEFPEFDESGRRFHFNGSSSHLTAAAAPTNSTDPRGRVWAGARGEVRNVETVEPADGARLATTPLKKNQNPNSLNLSDSSQPCRRAWVGTARALQADELRWREALSALVLTETTVPGLRCLARARQFVEGGWAMRAIGCGWPEVELFGICPRGWWNRFDRLGGAYLDFDMAEVTADALRSTSGLVLRRGSRAPGAVLPWGRSVDAADHAAIL